MLSILTISLAVLAQESVGNGVYEWKDNEISIRSTSDIDSITFALPNEFIYFISETPTSITGNSMTATYTISSPFNIYNTADTEIGVCYSSSNSQPTVDDSSAVYGIFKVGSWIVTINDLTNSTLYYYRPYFKFLGQVFYGQVKTFTTLEKDDHEIKGMALNLSGVTTTIWSTNSHCYFGYPAEMIIRDMLTGDYTHIGETGYSHFMSWNQNKYMGQDYMKQQFHWNYYYGFIGMANSIIKSIDESSANAETLSYLGTVYAYRAMLYVDLARMYEFLPNDIFSDGRNSEGEVVLNLTVPIEDEKTTQDQRLNNPRATRDEMFAFILSDLEKAEKYVPNLPSTFNNTLPDLACVYGLKARLYMWVENYAKAKEFARKAINATSIQPISESVALNPLTGYNQFADFMWCAVQTPETAAVRTGIINWTSWVSNQTIFGYTGSSTSLYTAIDKSMYNRISDTDWRKKQWVAPSGSTLHGQNLFLNDVDKATMPTYVSLKFRPYKKDAEDHLTGASTAIPMMRVEEMYFIEAEAAEHVSSGNGISLLNDFMKSYRDPNYQFNGRDAIDEIVFQKRVELWGEGQTFFDIKRLDMSVTRGYYGTNWQDYQTLLNTDGRPAWTNYVIVKNNNSALQNFNNPDPSDVYTPWYR